MSWALWLTLSLARADVVAEGAAILESGDVDGAIAVLEKGLDEPDPGVALYYNLGCAWYRKGDAVQALGWWRRARQLSPWDSDLAHNVALARTDLPPGQGRPAPVSERRAWRELMTPGPIAAMGLLSAAAGTGALGVARWQGLSRWPGALLWLAGLIVTALAVDGVLQERPIGVVVLEVARLRDAPGSVSQELGMIPQGTEVRVDERRQDWLMVVTGDGRAGWVPDRSVLVPGLAPAEAPVVAEVIPEGQPGPAPLSPIPPGDSP